MANVIMYATKTCPYCEKARALLRTLNVDFQEILITDSPEKREEMILKSNRHTVPQIFINGQHIGGCDDLYDLDKKNHLKTLLNQ